MFDYQALIHRWTGTELQPWADRLPAQLQSGFSLQRYGDLPRWQQALEQLPALPEVSASLDQAAVALHTPTELTPEQRKTLLAGLKGLHPWRKGPFDFFGVEIDTEWRSDWKWQRLAEHIDPLAERRVLDVGCGSGYHCWRMRGAGAREVIGIDPTPLFVLQYWALQNYLNDETVWVIPTGIEQVPAKLKAFDTVFSMGVLYHRRSPMDHLMELRDCLRPGGQLVLETLVVEGELGHSLVPKGRYARMGNVWFLPSCDTLLGWLEKVGLQDGQVVDVNQTSTEEQRATDWMTFHSLANFLDPDDPNKTIEGYPAPRRAIVTARVPGNWEPLDTN